MRTGPFQCYGQTSAGIEKCCITASVFPIASSFSKAGARSKTHSVRIDPLAQQRPVADQSFVGYLHESILLRRVTYWQRMTRIWRGAGRGLSKFLSCFPFA